MMETWKSVNGYEGRYEVSDQGRVRSLSRFIDHPNGSTWRRGKVLKPFNTGELRNYPTVQLEGANLKVHRLVANAFLENPEAKPQVNHLDGNPSNNKIDNLEWATSEENVQHAVRTGLLLREGGEACCNFKRAVDVFKDGKHVATLKGNKEMEDFGISPTKVSACLAGKRKSHKGYTFAQHLKKTQ